MTALSLGGDCNPMNTGQLGNAGSFVVTCTIGSVSVDATITKY